jgi:DNA-directed RNA polymerase specialized sigma24 family protein
MPRTTSRDERFERLYVEHCPAVRRYLRRRADAVLVEDTLSETFLVAWRRLDAIPDDALPWLLGVARRALANHGARRVGMSASPSGSRPSLRWRRRRRSRREPCSRRSRHCGRPIGRC